MEPKLTNLRGQAQQKSKVLGNEPNVAPSVKSLRPSSIPSETATSKDGSRRNGQSRVSPTKKALTVRTTPADMDQGLATSPLHSSKTICDGQSFMRILPPDTPRKRRAGSEVQDVGRRKSSRIDGHTVLGNFDDEPTTPNKECEAPDYTTSNLVDGPRYLSQQNQDSPTTPAARRALRSMETKQASPDFAKAATENVKQLGEQNTQLKTDNRRLSEEVSAQGAKIRDLTDILQAKDAYFLKQIAELKTAVQVRDAKIIAKKNQISTLSEQVEKQKDVIQAKDSQNINEHAHDAILHRHVITIQDQDAEIARLNNSLQAMKVMDNRSIAAREFADTFSPDRAQGLLEGSGISRERIDWMLKQLYTARRHY